MKNVGNLRKLFRKFIRAFGYDIHRIPFDENPQYYLAKSLIENNVSCVIDIGANEGQFASELIHAGYVGKIISIEPLPDAHAKLKSRADKNENWIVHDRAAVGREAGTVEINISSNSVSSSVLDMHRNHLNAAKNSTYIGTVNTKLETVDQIISLHCSITDRIFLKIDTQGYESQVLGGIQKSWEQIVGIKCEMSLVELYIDQKLWEEVHEHIISKNYSLWHLERGFTDANTGRGLQFDAIYFRWPK